MSPPKDSTASNALGSESPSASMQPAEVAAAADEPAKDPVDVEHSSVDKDSSSDGAESESEGEVADDSPPLPNETIPDGPPLPKEAVPDAAPPLPSKPLPQPEDDGWDCQWDPTTQAWFFANRFTGKTQWDNPRVPQATPAAVAAVPTAPGVPVAPGVPQPPVSEVPAAGGYNPAIHGDYDPNAWYAQGNNEEDGHGGVDTSDPSATYGVTATFNRFTGQFQTGDVGPERHTDEAKSRRQMNAFFDVDAAANVHDGRSLKAERSGKKPSKTELKAFKEKRRARKEEKRRAWLRD